MRQTKRPRAAKAIAVRASNAASDSTYSNEAGAQPGSEALDARNWPLYD